MILPSTRLWPTLAALVVVALTLSLGLWQLDRARFKEERAAQFDQRAEQLPIHVGGQPLDPAQINHARLIARGKWLPEYAVFLDNQVRHGQVGYFVYMPLHLEGSDMCLLVNRGWIGMGRDRDHLPEINSPRGGVEVHGTAQLPSSHFKELSNTYLEGRIWQNLTMDRFAKWSGLRLQPLVLWQTDDAQDGLARDWSRPDSGADRNRAYAFQWFAMAVATSLFWIYYFFKKESTHVD